MGMQGSLHDMAVADLIQHNCQEHKTAQLFIQHNGQQATLFFRDGGLVHAEMGGQVGEEVVYRLLGWEDGSFTLENGAASPRQTITRAWSGLLMEGARLLDEEKLAPNLQEPFYTMQPEVNQMAQKLDEVLKEMSNEVNGYVASIVSGMDGLNIAQHAVGRVDPEVISAQFTLLLKLVDTSANKLNAGVLEDELITTEKNYILMRFLPGKQYFLGTAVDRKSSNLGNLRLISRIYADRISKAIPR